MKYRHAIFASLIWLSLAADGPVQAQSDTGRLATVVELFTRQGCNSCPPADALLGRLAKRDGVIGLTFNVDYWDYLGWRDTLARPAYTQRQRGYAKAMHDRRVYTPQIVIGGVMHEVGSDEAAILDAIEKAREEHRAGLAIQMSRDGERIVVALSAGQSPVDATIWLARFDAKKEVAIRRGENGGRSLVYYKVVREFTNVGLWRGEAMEMAFSIGDLSKDGRDGCAIIVQLGSHGAIIGAAEMDFVNSDS